MRKMISPLPLLILCLILFALCGCQSAESIIPSSPVPYVSETLGKSGTNNDLSDPIQPSETAIIEDMAEDTGAIKKLLQLCAFPDNKEPLKKEFLALVKDVKKEGEKYILTIDKIEETNSGDIQDDYYTNKEAKNEEYLIDINNGGANVAIVVDPHNNFRAITLDGLKEYVKGIEDGIPFYFYSLDEELVLLLEMMLP